jgi:hypothetical protein
VPQVAPFPYTNLTFRNKCCQAIWREDCFFRETRRPASWPWREKRRLFSPVWAINGVVRIGLPGRRTGTCPAFLLDSPARAFMGVGLNPWARSCVLFLHPRVAWVKTAAVRARQANPGVSRDYLPDLNPPVVPTARQHPGSRPGSTPGCAARTVARRSARSTFESPVHSWGPVRQTIVVAFGPLSVRHARRVRLAA